MAGIGILHCIPQMKMYCLKESIYRLFARGLNLFNSEQEVNNFVQLCVYYFSMNFVLIQTPCMESLRQYIFSGAYSVVLLLRIINECVGKEAIPYISLRL